MNTYYETPTIEVLEIEVEQGFATSDVTGNGTEQMGWRDGSPWA